MAQQILGTAIKVLAKAAMKKKAKSSMAKKAAVAAGASNETRSVKKVPRKTAPSTGLENRGARPTGAQRRDRAQDYQFDKTERFMERAEELNYTDPLGARNRGPGKRSMRKAAAVKKEGSRKVINSQRNLSKAQKSGANKKALKAANKRRRGR
jgi:hypothetical protein